MCQDWCDLPSDPDSCRSMSEREVTTAHLYRKLLPHRILHNSFSDAFPAFIFLVSNFRVIPFSG